MMKFTEDIQKKIGDDKRDRISMTLSRGLIRRLKNYKQENKIETLSPLVEIMLDDWLKNKEMEETQG